MALFSTRYDKNHKKAKILPTQKENKSQKDHASDTEKNKIKQLEQKKLQKLNTIVSIIMLIIGMTIAVIVILNLKTE